MRRALTLTSLLMCLSLPALATPITLQFTGTMYVYHAYDDAGVGTDVLPTISNPTVRGLMTFDTSLAPARTSSGGAGGTYEQGGLATPLVEFVSSRVKWEGGSFTPTPLAVPPGAIEGGDAFILTNHVGFPDDVILADQFGWQTGDFDADVALSRIVLLLSSHFIDDAIGIPTGAEFPDLGSVTGRLAIQSLTSMNGTLYSGFQMGVDLQSISLVATRVPEPGSFALMACGLLAMGLLRRSRKPRLVPAFQ